MKKILTLFLIGSSFLLLYGFREFSKGHEPMRKFFNDFIYSKPYWWNDKNFENDIRESFAKKMTSDIEFAKNMADGKDYIPMNFTYRNRRVEMSKNLGTYIRSDGEYGVTMCSHIISSVKLKKPLPDGRKVTYVCYDIVTDVPADVKDFPYTKNSDTCIFIREKNPDSYSLHNDKTYNLGKYHITNKKNLEPIKVNNSNQKGLDTIFLTGF